MAKQTHSENDVVVIRKCSTVELLLLALCGVVSLLLGILLIVFVQQQLSLPVSIILFGIALACFLFFFIDLFFSMTIEGGKTVTVKGLFAETKTYTYTDVSWKIADPKKNRSSVILYLKGKEKARIRFGSENLSILYTFKHNGKFSADERAYLQKLKG